MYRKTYVEVNLDNLTANIKEIKKTYPNYDYYFGVVKGNAYGHGIEVVNTLINAGINYIAAATLDECLNIRKINNKIPILCLQPIHPKEVVICAKNNITVTITNLDFVRIMKNISLKEDLKIHLQLDVGMNRLGVKEQSDVEEILKTLKKEKNIFLEGIYTHFSTTGFIDNVYNKQAKKFKHLLANVDLKAIPIIHSFRSVTLIRQPKLDICNGIRPGIIMYGYNQNINIPNNFKNKVKQFLKKTSYLPGTELNLKPAFNLYSEIIEIKEVKQGEYVGYGLEYQAYEDMKIGIIAIGHGDGINKTGFNVLINNKNYPLIGVPMMDMLAVHIDDYVKLHDKVTIIGENLKAEELAKNLNATLYMLFNKITARVPRVYLKNGELFNEKQ